MRVQFENQAAIYGAHHKYASTRSVEMPVADLGRDFDRLTELMLEQALIAIESDGADTLIIGCTGMVGIAKSLQERLSESGYRLPVLDPIPVTVRLAKVLAESNLCHSKIAYPSPKRRVFRGYEHLGNLAGK